MSKRYGRNQKRAHRERIAQLEQAMVLNGGLLLHTRERLTQAEAVIDHARSVLGNDVSLPPALRGDHPDPLGGDFLLPIPSMQCSPGEPYFMPLELKVRQMRQMVCALEERAYDRALHFYVSLDSGQVAYAIDDRAFAELSEAHLAETLRGPISTALSHLLASHLKERSAP